MKIAVVGCGAVGGYYGAMLCRAGADVHFLLRSDFDQVRLHGLHVRSVNGDFQVRPTCARHPSEIGVADLILIALKTTANHALPTLLPPLLSPNTIVLTLQNGLGNEEFLAGLVPPGAIMGGLCFVCLNRLEPGVIQHLAHGKIVLGEYQPPPAPRTQAIAALFNRAGLPCVVADDLACAHWEKLVWNIPFNGLGVASAAGLEPFLAPTAPNALLTRRQKCLTTDLLLANPAWRQLVHQLMTEVIAAANALGHPIPTSCAEEQVQKTLIMGAYKPSTLLDFERGQPLERHALFEEPLRRAAAAGIPTPALARLNTILRLLE